eukprot:4378425-Amphidinium_carterae.1
MLESGISGTGAISTRSESKLATGYEPRKSPIHNSAILDPTMMERPGMNRFERVGHSHAQQGIALSALDLTQCTTDPRGFT